MVSTWYQIAGNVQGNVCNGNNPLAFAIVFVFLLLSAMIIYQVLKIEVKTIPKKSGLVLLVVKCFVIDYF